MITTLYCSNTSFIFRRGVIYEAGVDVHNVQPPHMVAIERPLLFKVAQAANHTNHTHFKNKILMKLIVQYACGSRDQQRMMNDADRGDIRTEKVEFLSFSL